MSEEKTKKSDCPLLIKKATIAAIGVALAAALYCLNDMATLAKVLIFGGAAMTMAFVNATDGFGTYTLRMVGIILVATLAVALAVSEASGNSHAAYGILGAIAGYLFGAPPPPDKK